MNQLHLNLKIKVPILVIFMGLLNAISYISVSAKPYIPKDENSVLEHLPLPNHPTKRKLRRLNRDLQKDKLNLSLAVDLAKEYIEFGRNSGDPRYISYAETTLKPWVKKTHIPNSVLLLQATIKQYRHNFDGALEDLNVLIKKDPRNIQALLTRSNIFRIQAKYQKSHKDCTSLALLAGPMIFTLCQANIDFLNQKAEEHNRRISKYLKLKSDKFSPSIKVWGQTTLGEIATSAGQYKKAQKHFQKAYKFNKENSYLISVYTDLLLDNRQYKRAYKLLSRKNLSDGVLLRRAIASRALRMPIAKKLVNMLEIRFSVDEEHEDGEHLREHARFELELKNNASFALKLAMKNWENQKEIQDAKIFLQAALSAKQPNTIKPIVEWVVVNKIIDVKINKLIHQIQEMQNES